MGEVRKEGQGKQERRVGEEEGEGRDGRIEKE